MASSPLIVGVLLVSGLLAGLLASRFGLPRVSAYVLTGVVFSPDLLGGQLGVRVGDWAEPLTASALGVVAYLIGGSITGDQLRRMGKAILGSAVGGMLGPVLTVFLAIVLFAPEPSGVSRWQLALAMAAIATTTAPAATVAVLHQYRAKGPVSTTLLGVVAVDDALGIILFSFMLVVAGGGSTMTSLKAAGLEIGGSLVLGTIAGSLLAYVGCRVKQSTLLLPMLLGGVLTVVGVAQSMYLSPLLSAMVLGFFTRYRSGAAGDRMFGPIEYLEEAVFIIFFTLAGAHFLASVFLASASIAAVYFLARVAGKLAGATLGARISGAPKSVVRWLGLGLLPQAGVAVGLALSLMHHPTFRDVSVTILNAILTTTILYEILGPFAVRFGLGRAGEIGEREEIPA